MMQKRALISVSDKTGIVAFAKELVALDYEIISTGGSATFLLNAGISVREVADVTGFPEIMNGRVKTLHPHIHGGILAIREAKDHQQEIEKLGINYIDIVVVNLYPFKETILTEGVTYQQAIENIDIGGPTMLRSAAKNHKDVTVITDFEDYNIVIEQLKVSGETTFELRQKLSWKAFSTTAAYDALITEYFSQFSEASFPQKLTVTYELQQNLRYGENPQQQAAYYKSPLSEQNSLVNAQQLQGKELSYNNINDANYAIDIAQAFTCPVVIAIKHMNPCGVGIGPTLHEAFLRAKDADPISIFGGIIVTNQTVDDKTAAKLAEIFLEVIIAPNFTPQAQLILAEKKNLRLLKMAIVTKNDNIQQKQITSIKGGILLQTTDTSILGTEDLQCVTIKKPTPEIEAALLFAWKVVKYVKSNAIVIANGQQTLGIGAGQMNRVGAAKIALEQAGIAAKGQVMSSDAFFPMSDTVELAAKAGIVAIIQPGGSIKDKESIEMANKYGIIMVFTGIRHFKH
ncbi:MAG: bifunctional phosphoribosylaminoimidazolecarboxamide formyltransferase/IMP cyclohydrolase [Culicoidibacterales bacterium]